jgi:hypothetical protein
VSEEASDEDRKVRGESERETALREKLEGLEAERDSLLEDADGWRTRCKGLEDKLAEEKRIGGIERDLARERIRKRTFFRLLLTSSCQADHPDAS